MNWPRPGTVVYVRFLVVFTHKGIVSDRWWNGKPMVIANSQDTRGVAEVPWDTFTGKRAWFVEGYPSRLPPYEVLHNARCKVGQPYDIWQFNCEHFVYGCHGKQPNSPQVAALGILAALGLIAIIQS